MNRKEFVSAFGRISILSIMAAMLGLFISRDKLAVQSECSVNKYCGRCDQLEKCTLPGALKEKKNGKG